ncbi:MAG TPA: MnmC family methyltransferase, partial [Mucilaginibacter sp.]
EMMEQTGYHEYIRPELWDAFLSNYPAALTQTVETDNFTRLQIAHCPLMDFTTENKFDVVYFDAFAAAHQPEMWNQEAISHVAGFLKPGGVFVTYAITGNLKRMLKALGFQVEKAPGAPGKREMLRATLLPTGL